MAVHEVEVECECGAKIKVSVPTQHVEVLDRLVTQFYAEHQAHNSGVLGR